MGIGVRLMEVTCDLESASGRWARRRNRQRRRGSDELAVFAATHDLATGQRLSYFKFVRGDVDTGDVYHPEQSFLGPSDSTDQIVLSLAAREVDGAGSRSTLVDREFQHWVASTQQLGPIPLTTGQPSSQPGDVAAEVVGSVLSAGFHWLGAQPADELIAVDRMIVTRSGPGGTLTVTSPEDGSEIALSSTAITLSRSVETVDGNAIATTAYDSRDANSRYTLSFEFRD